MASDSEKLGGRHNIEVVSMDEFVPSDNTVFVHNMYFGEDVLESGIVLTNDDGKEAGIKPRWCQVWRVGAGQEDVKAGDWILMKHGRWTRHINSRINGVDAKIRQIDTNDMLLVSDTKPDVHNIKLADFAIS